jgi:hypothetical protein
MSTKKNKPAPATRYQVLYEDPEQGWQPTNLGIYDNEQEARTSAGHWLTGYLSRGRGKPRMAVQALKPQLLPEGAVLI